MYCLREHYNLSKSLFSSHFQKTQKRIAMIVELVVQLISLLWLIDPLAAAPSLVIKPGCQELCGNVSIPYPFGIGEGCYHDKWYEITCNQSFNPPKPFLHIREVNLEVLEVSLTIKYGPYSEVTVSSPIASNCRNIVRTWTSTNLSGSPFYFTDGNSFTVMGCGSAFFSYVTQGGEVLAGCTSTCKNNAKEGSCITSSVPHDDSYSVNVSTTGNCTYAFLLDSNYNLSTLESLESVIRDTEHAPMAIAWMITNQTNIIPVREGVFSDYYCYTEGLINATVTAYYCSCGSTYEGNPYIPHGCKVIEACAHCNGKCVQGRERGEFICEHNRIPIILGVSIGGGSLFLLLGGFWLYKVIRKMRNIRLRKRFFKRNGGLLLQQQMSSDEGAVEKTKVFNSMELEKATDNFNKNRILGQGGQGTVYKGMLTDGRIVAIKKSKLVDESQLEQFINEVVILSQINHRNVVNLLGCCLETEVPLLVYEFIPNGTLFQLIHDQNEEFPLSWEMRIQIAIEVAGAIAYLHSASSIPIYHRDIKSTNILLDDKYRAKVADFGTSRSISIEQTHLTTIVQGTFGYLDPEYFQSSQFTDKSDVYSFGVVLVELLTGQKPISSARSQEEKNLVTHFILSLKETRLFDILDARVMKEGEKQEIMAVANLAKRCLNLNGKKRPTMKEVTMELEGSRRYHMPSTAQKKFQEGECIVELTGPLDGASASTSSCSDYTGTFASDVHPLLHNTV